MSICQKFFYVNFSIEFCVELNQNEQTKKLSNWTSSNYVFDELSFILRS